MAGRADMREGAIAERAAGGSAHEFERLRASRRAPWPLQPEGRRGRWRLRSRRRIACRRHARRAAACRRCSPVVSDFWRTLASRVERMAAERCDVDAGSRIFGARHGVLDDELQDVLEPVVAEVMEGGRPWWRRRGCGRFRRPKRAESSELEPWRKQVRIWVRADFRSFTAPGPAFSAVIASTSTIWRSSLAKWPKKKGFTMVAK